ncbi:DUF6338 family protein [Sunxiuqinia dokdonensis]|nr:DUF6338 family protein [Sunxiuqinia dokdonensis]
MKQYKLKISIMDILSVDKLVLFLFFFVPGFISLKFYQLLIADEKVDFSKSLYEAVGFSCINFSIFFWVIYHINKPEFVESHPFYYYAITLTIIFITPLILTWFLSMILKTKVFGRFFVSPEKVPWDWHFSKRDSSWVIVTLKDGKKIGGKFGKKSSASTFPRSKEIYIEDIWKLDKNHKFINSIERNTGVLITGDSILAIEFFS